MTYRPLTALLLLALAFPLLADETPALDKTYGYRVSVDAEGKVTAFEPSSEIPGALLPTLDALVENAEFEPAQVGTRAVPSLTSVYVVVRFEGGGDELRAAPVKVTSGGGTLNSTPPRYPSTAIRNDFGALVWATLSFKADGSLDREASRIDSVDVVRGTGRPSSRQIGPYKQRFEDATWKAMANWTLTPDEVDGQPVAMTVRVPTRFCPMRNRPTGCSDLWPKAADPLPRPSYDGVRLAAIKPAASVADGG